MALQGFVGKFVLVVVFSLRPSFFLFTFSFTLFLVFYWIFLFELFFACSTFFVGEFDPGSG